MKHRMRYSAVAVMTFAALAIAWATVPGEAQISTGCTFGTSGTQFSVGETMNWNVRSRPLGLDVFLSGTKDGAPDADHVFAGTSPVFGSYTFGSGDVGVYTRFAELEDESGLVCTTSTVTITVDP